MRTRKHFCLWPGCEQLVEEKRWGCTNHWLRLRHDFKCLVWRHYDPLIRSLAYQKLMVEIGEWIKSGAVLPPDSFKKLTTDEKRTARQHAERRNLGLCILCGKEPAKKGCATGQKCLDYHVERRRKAKELNK